MSTKLFSRIRTFALALAVAAGAAGAVAGPALAADWGHRDRHEQRGQHWRYHNPHRVVYAQPYNYVVAPPPPVVYAAPVPSFSLVVPLTIR